MSPCCARDIIKLVFSPPASKGYTYQNSNDDWKEDKLPSCFCICGEPRPNQPLSLQHVALKGSNNQSINFPLS